MTATNKNQTTNHQENFKTHSETGTSKSGLGYLCDNTACLEIMEQHEHGEMENDLGSTCKFCVAKQANTAVLLFEAIPLSIKLIFLVTFAVISLIIFGALLIKNSAQSLNGAKNIKRVAEISLVFSDLVRALEDERSFAVIYFGFNGTTKQYQTYTNATDTMIQRYKDQSLDWYGEVQTQVVTPNSNDQPASYPSGRFLGFLNTNNLEELKLKPEELAQINNGDWDFQKVMNTVDDNVEGEVTGYTFLMDYYISNLQSHRQNVIIKNFTDSLAVLDFYSKWIGNIVDGISILSSESDDSEFKMMHYCYTRTIQLTEIVNLKRSYTVYGIVKKAFSMDVYYNLLYIGNQYFVIFNEFNINANKPIRDLFALEITNNQKLENQLGMYEFYAMLALPNTFSYFDVYANYSTKIKNMHDVQDYIRNLTIGVADDIQQKAIGGLIGYSISTTFVVVFSIAVALFFARTIVVPWQKLLRAQKDKTKQLADSYTHLNLLLERISAEEVKTRKILNAMEDALITINSYGFVVHCNESFYRMFQYTESDVLGFGSDSHGKVNIQYLIPNLDLKELFIQFNHLDTVITPDKDLKAISKHGKDFPVRVNLNFCKLFLNDLSSQLGTSHEDTSSVITSNTTSILSNDKILQQEQACIILIHNLSEKHHLETNLEHHENPELAECRTMLKNPTKKSEFKNYCKKAQLNNSLSEECYNNVLFVEDIIHYKNTQSIQERVYLQQDIYNNYIAENAKRKLHGIPKEAVDAVTFKIKKALGEAELFDNLERLVVQDVVNEIYMKWKDHEKSELQSYL
ncbi:hypothetical protein ABK040_013887 [Willaertia magna]